MRIGVNGSWYLAMTLVGIVLLPIQAQVSAKPRAGAGRLVDRVVRELEDRFSPRWFDDETLAATIARARRQARRAPSVEAERELVQEILEVLPTSHLGLLTEYGYRRLDADLEGRAMLTVGFQLVQREGGYFVCDVLCRGAGERAGIREGDRIVAIDGLPPARSPRLDRRTDDAALPDEPRHYVRVESRRSIRFTLEVAPGETLRVDVEPERDSAAAADRRAAGSFEWDGRRFYYLPLRFMYHEHAVRLVEAAIRGPLEACEGLVLDLRGRGGSAEAAATIARLLLRSRSTAHLTIVCLVDAFTRSAKEVLAYDLAKSPRVTLVGERTAGALRPCTFESMGDESVLMAPVGSGTHEGYTAAIELKGIDPDVRVEADPRWAAGRDPIFERGVLVLAAQTRGVDPRP